MGLQKVWSVIPVDVIIPKEIWDADMGATDIAVYAALMTFDGPSGCFPSIKSIATRAKLSKTTVVASIRRLESANLITKYFKGGVLSHYTFPLNHTKIGNGHTRIGNGSEADHTKIGNGHTNIGNGRHTKIRNGSDANHTNIGNGKGQTIPECYPTIPDQGTGIPECGTYTVPSVDKYLNHNQTSADRCVDAFCRYAQPWLKNKDKVKTYMVPITEAGYTANDVERACMGMRGEGNPAIKPWDVAEWLKKERLNSTKQPATIPVPCRLITFEGQQYWVSEDIAAMTKTTGDTSSIKASVEFFCRKYPEARVA